MSNIAFLIDADNLNDPAAICEAFEKLHALVGPSTIRRAYGSADNLKAIATALNRFSVRPCGNFALSKNTTDIALAVDAMEMACTLAPRVVAIGSGDADFFPLAVRLRERGIRVVCFSLHGKMSEETAAGYGECITVGRRRDAGAEALAAARPVAAPVPRAPAAASRKTPARKAAAPKKAAVKKAPSDKATAKKTAAGKTPAKKAAAKKTPARKTAAAAAPAPAADVPAGAASSAANPQRILAALPALRTGATVSLNDAARGLREANLLGKNTSSPKLFQRFPLDFELTPATQPHHVRWLKAPSP